MFKKIGITAALSASLIFGGAFAPQADASANEQPSIQSSYKIFYFVNGQWNDVSQDQITSAIDKVKQLVDWDSIFNQVNLEEQDSKDKDEKTPEKEIEKPESNEQEEKEEPAQPEKEAPAEPEEEVEQPKQDDDKQANESEEQKDSKEQEQEQAPAPSQPKPEQNNNQNQQNEEQNQQLSQFEQEVVELTNQERQKNGLAPLEVDTDLSNVAREKSSDMQSSNYFDHNSPNYGSPFDMMQSFGIDYRTAGENIAQGQRSPEEVVNAWMNSEGHRANILNGDYTHIGVGHVENGNYWTQMFIGK